MIKKIIPITAVCALFLTGCYKQVQANDAKINSTATKIKSAARQQDNSPAVVNNSGYYVDTQPISLTPPAKWLTQRVDIEAQALPFQLLVKRITANTPLTVSFDQINLQTPVTFRFHGSLSDALNALAASTNYAFTLDGNVLQWSGLQTQTFDISFMPGSSKYLVGQQANGEVQNTLSSGSTVSSQINGEQYSNLAANLSVWNDLTNTLNQLKSPQGKVVVSESTTSVTVSDHPSNIAAIDRYIKKLNKTLTQQVSIKVQVLEVQLNSDFNYGVDWNLITKALGTNFSLTGQAGSATNLIANNLILGSAGSATTSLGVGSSGTDAIIQALSQQGKVHVVTEPEIVTLNNQIASIRITNNIGYIQSVSQTQSENFNTTSINPGNVVDGFTLYVLPKIENSQVFMQISSTIASLEQLQKESTQPDQNTNSNNSEYQAIQVPTLAQKSFNQRSLVNSGSTLIIAGYKQLRDATATAKMFGVSALGGQGGTSNSLETLVLITPIILQTDRSDVHINTK